MMAGASSPMGFSYSGDTNPATIQIQQSGFDQSNTAEIFNLTAGMIGFHQPDVVSWQNQNDDSSLRCVFPNERPSQGLSLSLSSTNPSGIGLQSFELRPTQHQNDDDHMRFLTRNNNGFFFGKSQPQDQMMMTIEDGSLSGKQVNNFNFQLRHSTYLAPAKELLNEFCSLETTSQGTDPARKQQSKNERLESKVDNNGTGSTSNQSPSSSSLYSLDIIELQKRKAKLLCMLEELDRRYSHYGDQMKAVVSVFEAAAGTGAAKVYSALAAKAMSRHFRSLRDGIVSQIQATKKAMGEKDPVTPGATRGETPRLRVLDQTLRQQRAFQQMAVMETHPWRPQRGLPERSVSVLRAWLFEHFLHPYPSDVDKHILARQTGLSRSQVSNWFINARVRLWKPMVEEMYVEETKEQDNLNHNNNMGLGGSSDDVTAAGPDRLEEHKPTADQLVRIDSECLSSIISNPDKDSSSKNIMNQSNHYGTTSYGAMELDFASYNSNQIDTVSFPRKDINLSFNGGVSLTLGLQQQGNSLAAHQSSLFYSRDHHQNHVEMEPVVQYNMMDGEAQNHLPYRNLMGAQLLHDLAG